MLSLYRDILVAASDRYQLQAISVQTQKALQKRRLKIASDKVQMMSPWKYLGWKILDQTIEPQNVQLKIDAKTLSDLQKLLGTIN